MLDNGGISPKRQNIVGVIQPIWASVCANRRVHDSQGDRQQVEKFRAGNIDRLAQPVGAIALRAVRASGFAEFIHDGAARAIIEIISFETRRVSVQRRRNGLKKAGNALTQGKLRLRTPPQHIALKGEKPPQIAQRHH